jgi:hypothetical protein
MSGSVKHKEQVVTIRTLNCVGLGVTESGKIVFSKEKFCRTAQLDGQAARGVVWRGGRMKTVREFRMRAGSASTARQSAHGNFWGFLDAVEADGWWK